MTRRTEMTDREMHSFIYGLCRDSGYAIVHGSCRIILGQLIQQQMDFDETWPCPACKGSGKKDTWKGITVGTGLCMGCKGNGHLPRIGDFPPIWFGGGNVREKIIYTTGKEGV